MSFSLLESASRAEDVLLRAHLHFTSLCEVMEPKGGDVSASGSGLLSALLMRRGR